LACEEGDIEIVKLLMSRDDLNINREVRTEEIRWNLSLNNFD